MPPMGLPIRPGELNTYGPAGGGFGAPHLPDVMDVDGHALGCYLRPGLLGNDGAVSGPGGVKVRDLDGATRRSLRFATVAGPPDLATAV